jgi:hypothetical protein
MIYMAFILSKVSPLSCGVIILEMWPVGKENRSKMTHTGLLLQNAGITMSGRRGMY